MARARPDALPIDAHVHFWAVARGDYGWLDAAAVAPIRRDFAPADYPGAGRVIAVQAAPSPAETGFLLDLAAAEPRIAGVVFTGSTDTARTIAATMAANLRPGTPLLVGYAAMFRQWALAFRVGSCTLGRFRFARAPRRCRCRSICCWW